MPALRVIKIGGSLLDLPRLSQLVRELLALPERSPLIVIGGGPTAGLVRSWDQTHSLGADTAHWLAMEAMGLNESLLERLCPELRPVRSGTQLQKAVNDGVPAIVCASCFVRWGEAVGHSLAHSWEVTSDSVAAWVARVVQAEELILVKSLPVPGGRTAREASRAGLVDPAFPEIAEALPVVRWINGRTDPWTLETWLTFGERRELLEKDTFGASPDGSGD